MTPAARLAAAAAIIDSISQGRQPADAVLKAWSQQNRYAGSGDRRAIAERVYQVLRGKDLDPGEFTAERRDIQFKLLQDSQAEVLNLTHWHQFLSCLIGAGFRSAEMISSQNAMLCVCFLFDRPEAIWTA